MPLPEAGTSENICVHLGKETLNWGAVGTRLALGGKSGLELEMWASAVCNGNQRTSRTGWGP